MKSARPRKAGARKTASRGGAARGGRPSHVYRLIEIAGSSPRSIEEAIETALARAHETLRNLRWFEVVRTGGHIVDGRVAHYQVTLKVGFTMEEPG